ncbi:pyridoxamine 5'-phosphate oxidase family protein [Actinoplanes sp. G11-F43]|uniref:pyridoxamine 5'-phosphate oxidase family protein n=1 Tax=Actinoplanes sp. G11-F43 TaxID=3424130 RepID=UPI003D32E138
MLTDDDLEFLGRPLHGFLTVAGGPEPAQPRPIWFEAGAGGLVRFITEPGSLKVRRLRADPRVALVVAAPVGERERWVSVTGRAVVDDEGATELCERLAARYWDMDDPARGKDLAAMVAGGLLRVTVQPEKVFRFSF